MARFFHNVKIDTIYLTSTGSESGDDCKLEVINVEDLDVIFAGTAFPVSSGKTKIQLVEWVEGKEFSIRVSVLMADVYEQLRNHANEILQLLFVDQNDADAVFVVSGEGDSGDFEVAATWNPNTPYACERFRNGRIFNIVFRFITKGVIE